MLPFPRNYTALISRIVLILPLLAFGPGEDFVTQFEHSLPVAVQCVRHEQNLLRSGKRCTLFEIMQEV